MNDRIAKCKSITYGIQSIGSYKVPVNPIVASKLYNDVCIPTLCYGSEVLEIIKSSINEMEKFHCQTAKMIQGLPSQSSNTASLVTMGWHSVQVFVDIARLMFVWRILLLPMSSLYEIIMVRRILELSMVGQGSGPVWNIIQTCNKYNLLQTLLDAINTGEYVSIRKWKKNVRAVVCQKDTNVCKLKANSTNQWL